jgi:protein-tyrosine phosphatase
MALIRFEVPLDVSGRLWMMPCPTAQHLDELALRGVDRIVSMLGQKEAKALGMGQEAQLCEDRGMAFVGYPIEDFGLPDIAPFHRFIHTLLAQLTDGAQVAVHCRAGIGRSGMVAASVLIGSGLGVQTAIDAVSAARGVSIPDTVEQADFISRLAAYDAKA